MKTLFILAAIGIAFILSGCVDTRNNPACPAEWYKAPGWYLECSGNKFMRGWRGGGGMYDGLSTSTDNRGGMEKAGFYQNGNIDYVMPNAYAPGVGMNQSGGAVKTVPAN